mgnify:CR=1 FL=1
MFITLECNSPDLDLFAPVDGKLHPDGASDYSILLCIYLYVDIIETLLLVISLDDTDRSLGHIIRIFSSTTKVQTLLEFLLLT